jgi:hypothetical protein
MSSVLPVLDAEGLLPPGRHRATMDEVYARFVADAPFRAERQLVFDALTTYTALVRRTYRKGAFWMDGGFVTHKTWAPPHDVDLAVVVRAALIEAADPTHRPGLFTLQHVYVAAPALAADRVQPMGGLVDAFRVPRENHAELRDVDRTWSSVRDRTGSVVPGRVKGYVEVVW